MSWDQLRNKRRDWAYCITIAGLKYRFYDRAAPPATPIHLASFGGSSELYEDIPALLNISGISDSYDAYGGIANHSPLSITLASRGRFAQSLGDPGVVFGRITHKSADWSARCLTEMNRTTTSDIEVDTDPSSLSFPRMLHIDGETIYAGSHAASPYRLTDITRGVARSPIQDHGVDVETDSFSEVTTDVCHWRTRWATIHIAPVYADGSTGDWVELMHGFIDASPATTSDGTVEFAIAPLTALLDVPLVTPNDLKRETSLLSGFHHFAYPECCTMQHVQEIPLGSHSPSASYNGSTTPGVLVVDNALDAVADNTWKKTWDIAFSLPQGQSHPRLAEMDVEGETAEIVGFNGVPVGYLLDAGAANTGNHVDALSRERREVHQCQAHTGLGAIGDEETLRWPQDVVAAVSDSVTGWTPNPGSMPSADGSWLDVSMSQDIFTALSWVGYSRYIRFLWKYGEDGWTYNASGYAPTEWSTGEAKRNTQPIRFVHYPVRPVDGQGAFIPGGNLPGLKSDVVGLSVRASNPAQQEFATPTAFYQRGERYLLVEDQIPANGQLKISIPDSDAHGGCTHYIPYTTVTAVSYDGAVVGYKVKLDPRQRQSLPSFGDWGAQYQSSRVKIEVRSEFVDYTSKDLLLELLTSGGGDSVNGNYDRQTFGLNLPSTSSPVAGAGAWGALRLVDEGSFSISGPSIVESWTLPVGSESTVRDLIKDVCIVTNSVLVMQRKPDGTCMLTRVELSPAADAEIFGVIRDADWLTEVTPHTGVDDRIFTRQVYNVNFDADGESLVKVEVNDQRAIRTHGEADTLEMNLNGVRIDAHGSRLTAAQALDLQPLYSRLSRLLGDERIVWRGMLPTYLSIQMRLGGVYSISSIFLKGHGAEHGVSNAAGRLISVDIGLMEEGASVEFVFYGTRGSGWNACMNARVIASPTSVIVSTNAFTDTRNRYTGESQTDIDHFAVGDAVYVYQTGAMDTGVSLTITSISGAAITFSGAHGLTSPAYGYIIPADSGFASDDHLALSYIADGGGTVTGGSPTEIL